MILGWRLGTAGNFHLATVQNFFPHSQCHRWNSKCISYVDTRMTFSQEDIIMVNNGKKTPVKILVVTCSLISSTNLCVALSPGLKMIQWSLQLIRWSFHIQQCWVNTHGCWFAYFIGAAGNAFILETSKLLFYWICQKTDFNARGVNLEFLISQSWSDRTKLCGTFSRKKQIAIMFQKLFSSPILVEWVSITTTRCVYLVSYNLNNLSFTFQNHWNMCILCFLW